MKKSIFLSLLCFLFLTTSCEDFFEYEGDCDVTHEIRFVYDMNLKWANAFSSEVKSVNLYVFDNEGVFVKEYIVRGNALKQSDYGIILDLPTNHSYQFLAWCGLDNTRDEEESFIVPSPQIGITSIEEMSATLRTIEENGLRVSDNRLNFFFHGYIETYLTDNHNGQHYIHTIPLTKDTNHIRIMLQQVNGNLNEDDFYIKLEADNGVLAWNNLPQPNIPVTYTPWNFESDILGVGNSEGEQVEYFGVIADLSTSRLMAEESSSLFLTVSDKEDGTLLFKVPMIQYFLSEKNYYEMAYGHDMTDQEFLDRQDEYFMTFFLDDKMQWLYAVIEILEWRVVIKNYEVSS